MFVIAGMVLFLVPRIGRSRVSAEKTSRTYTAGLEKALERWDNEGGARPSATPK